MSQETPTGPDETRPMRVSVPPLSDTSLPDIASDPRGRRALAVTLFALLLLLQLAAELMGGREPGQVAAQIGVWTLELAVLMILLETFFARAARGKRASAITFAQAAALAGVTGALFGALIFYLAEAYPALRFRTPRVPLLSRAVVFGFAHGVLYAGLWALAFVVPRLAEDARVRALESEKLRTALELERLRAHLEPHFLLNTLNAIAGLVTEEPRHARRLLADLGELLREAVRTGDELHTVDEEVRFLERYTDIMQSRHPERLAFAWDIAEGSRTALVPRLFLQPIVENAVRHGALKRREGGSVTIRTRVDSDRGSGEHITCVVEDNGPGPTTETRDGAFGLLSVRRRLELDYGSADLRLERFDEGTRTTVVVPRIVDKSRLSPIGDAT